MSHHLSLDQFSKCALGQLGSTEKEHLSMCRTCAIELETFADALAQFRSAVRHDIDARLSLRAVKLDATDRQTVGLPQWRWALVIGVMVFLITLPLFTRKDKPPESNTPVSSPISGPTDPNEVMERVNLHLSRTIPSPMEPIMSLIPSEEITITPGGVQ